MIVYGHRTEGVDPRAVLRSLIREVDECIGLPIASPGGGGWTTGGEFHDRVVSILIGWGELEVGLIDHLTPDQESDLPIGRLCRDLAIHLGHTLRVSWAGDLMAARGYLARCAHALNELAGYELPESIEVGTHEGFAYYALYPESYLEAASNFVREVGAEEIVTLGLRSIGATLSAVVAAEFEAARLMVSAYTVRPRGHPFSRYLRCSAEFEAQIRELSSAHFVIVDEGPGLSGSSFAAVAEWLASLGVPDDRITLFPSHITDGQRLLSPLAQARWPRHRQYMVPFEEIWLRAGRFAALHPEGRLVDLGAGAWRALFYRGEEDYPAIHPQSERRKYLVMGDDGSETLLKFVGLGRYGRRVLELQQRLADAGFTPAPRGLMGGFLITDFIEGRPLTATDADDRFLEVLARYLAFRSAALPGGRGVPFDALIEMIEVNVGHGLGEGWVEVAGDLEGLREVAMARRTTLIDGRILPYEWLRTPTGYQKVDAVDHHSDHFFPGPQDIAWDLAGAVVEFGLGGEVEDRLVDRYIELSGDRGVVEVMRLYRVAYLAFRLGYMTFGAAGSEGAEGFRLRREAQRYRATLELELSGISRSGRRGARVLSMDHDSPGYPR